MKGLVGKVPFISWWHLLVAVNRSNIYDLFLITKSHGLIGSSICPFSSCSRNNTWVTTTFYSKGPLIHPDEIVKISGYWIIMIFSSSLKEIPNFVYYILEWGIKLMLFSFQKSILWQHHGYLGQSDTYPSFEGHLFLPN